MTGIGWAQIALFCVLIILCARPVGGFMTRLFAGERTFLHPVIGPVERGFYRLAGIDERVEQHWLSYTIAMLVFSLASTLLLYAILRFQDVLPLNPSGLPAVPADLAFNTAVSFVSNTNWQSYGGEGTMSYFSQMVGLTVQNFLSAAVGIALAIVFIRAFARGSARTVGNFWVDLTRASLYLLLPVCIIGSILLVAQGVPQNLGAYVDATTLEGAHQTIAQGPVASQMMIKHLGTNGGGFFNANAAHPYENPTPLTNMIHMLAIFAIGAGLTNVLGRMVRDERQGWAVFAAMGAMFLIGLAVVYWQEAGGNPILTALGLDPSGGNMEGKEVRFGIAASALFAVITTAASCGAVNAMHASFTALGGMVPMINMQLGEIVVGGVGAGLYGMLLMCIEAVFVAGLMVGRTPEYLGKKIEGYDVKMTVLATLIVPAAILVGTAVAGVHPLGLAGLLNKGPHGFSEILYAYSSAAANNGSAFASLSANSVFYNFTLGVGMVLGRFALIVPMMAVAGNLAAKRSLAASAGTFPTHGPLFVALLVGVILVVAGLTFFPALALGPVVEHLMMQAGTLF